MLRLDRARYLAYLEQDEPPPLPPPSERFVGGLWSRRLLVGLDLPEDDTLIQEIELDGDVVLIREGLRMTCNRLRDWPAEGRGEIEDVEIRMPPGSGAPNGWPLTIRAKHLREDADGAIYARSAAFSTCDADPLHWSVRFSSVRAQRNTDGSLRWNPSGAWLRAGRIPLVPLPSPQFGDGDSFLGFRGVRLESSRHYGAMIEPRFGWRWHVPQMDLTLDTELFVGLSSRRGVPLRLEGALDAGRMTSRFSLFLLNDRGADRTPLRRAVARDSDTRTRVRWNTRTHLDRSWTLETDLALASDPLVDPEFFNRTWTREHDARTKAYLRRRGDDTLFETSLQYRLDDFEFTPLGGYGAPGSSVPRTLATLPRVRFESFSDEVLTLPAGFLGGRDGRVPLNAGWGAEVARLQLRDMDLDPAAGLAPFVSAPRVTRDRARMWAELAAPMSAAGAFFRPGARLTASSWHDDLPGAEDDAQAHFEGFVEAGVVLQRTWPDGWRHRLLPQIRLRSRTSIRDADMLPLDFDGADRILDGEVVELSLRQFFHAPDRSQPWLDVDLLIPWYPDEAELLLSDVTPFPRSASFDSGFGPVELRVVWTPGGLDDALEGVRWEARVRHDLSSDDFEEWFTRLRVQPDPALSYGFEYYEVDGTPSDFALGSLFAAYRFAEEWGAGFRQSVNFDGDAGLNSAYMLHHYGHDFLYEFGWTRREATGEEGFYFFLTPRFLEESYGSGSLARLRWQ